MLYFLLHEKTAFHVGINKNINGRHTGGLKADNAAAIGIPPVMCNIKMLAEKTINVLHSIFIFIIYIVGHNFSVNLFHFQINDAAAAATTPYSRQQGTEATRRGSTSSP